MSALSPDDDLPILQQQEELLQLPVFGPDEAWRLGSLLRSSLLQRRAGGTVEIERAGQLLFSCATVGATPGQANWIRRKRNTVHHFARSTYAVGRKLERDQASLPGSHGLSEMDFCAHGGGFPLILTGTGMVGSVVLSGLPQRDDHNLVVDGLAELTGIHVPRLRS